MSLHNQCTIAVRVLGDGETATIMEFNTIRFEGPQEKWDGGSAPTITWRMFHSSHKGDSRMDQLCYVDLVHLRNAIDALLIAHEDTLKRTP